jgi:hypothetical protein
MLERRPWRRRPQRASANSGVRRGLAALLLWLLVGVACGKAGSSGSPLSPQALKLAVLDAVGGHLTYCDPDVYPVGHGTPVQNARARFPTIKADRAAFQAILAHEHLTADQRFTPDQLIAINEDYKQMQAIDLKPADGGYRFTVLTPTPGSNTGITRLSGTVSGSGAVTIAARAVGQQPNCPICLAAGVNIATPMGAVLVQDVRVGMRVWTTDLYGRRIIGVVLETGNMQAPLGHEVVRLALADGRTVMVSPRHPTADGRTVGELEPGAVYDGSTVMSTALVAYAGRTWDLLPSGPTGTYFANGVLLGSTLEAHPTA